tara:strand:+ start:5449 stop:6630 length:1182 start_codon:yes stop_codon:yes gene_type:complete
MSKIFFIDRYINYSTKLFESMVSISSKKKDFDLFFIGPNDTKNILFSDQILVNSKKIWSKNHYVRKLLKFILINKPDIVHFTFELRTFGSPWSSLKLPLLLFLLHLKKQKIVISLFVILFYYENNNWKLPDYFPSKLPKPIIKILLKLFFSILLKLCDKIIVGTNYAKLCMVDYYKINEEKISVIPFGISSLPKHVNENTKEKFQKIFDGKKIILCFGVISPRKNYLLIVRAFKEVAEKLPDHMLVIAGTSTNEFKNYESVLRDLVKDLHLTKQVFFTGFIKNDEIDVLFQMAESTLFLYSPMSDSTHAITISIQHNKPIIVSDIEIIREILPQESALFIDLKDISQLSNAILKISTEPEIRKNLNSKLIKLTKKFTWNNSAENCIKTYESML